MPVPAQPKIYHIVHVDRLASIIVDGSLWSDAVMVLRQGVGTTIGMSNIKARRLNELSLSCYPDLRVGHCTPFYFCPRSVMLYLIYRRNEELAYKGGQEPIVHLEADLHATIAWSQQNDQRWEKQETVSRFDRVGKLVEGFETPFVLELLATVHWVATREKATSVQDAAEKVYAWNDRKKRFSPRQIGIAFETLRAKGWLTAA